jgi:hypothetical protein
MNSFWMPKKQPLYAPMLSTFGGGSARGFNPGGGGGGMSFTSKSIFDGNYSSYIKLSGATAYRGMMFVYEDYFDTGDDHLMVFKEQASTWFNSGEYRRRTAGTTLALQSTPTTFTGSNANIGGARDVAYYVDTNGNYNVYVSSYASPNGVLHYTLPGGLSDLRSDWSNATHVADFTPSSGSSWGVAVDFTRHYLYLGTHSNNLLWRWDIDPADGSLDFNSRASTQVNGANGQAAGMAVAYDPWADAIYTGTTYSQSPLEIVVLDAANWTQSPIGRITVSNLNSWVSSIGCIEVSEDTLYFQGDENSASSVSKPITALSR